MKLITAIAALALLAGSVEGQDERQSANRQAELIRGIVDRVMEGKMATITDLILAERAAILSAIVDERSEIVSAITERLDNAAESTPAASQAGGGELLALIRAGKVKATCVRRDGRFIKALAGGGHGDVIIYKPYHSALSGLEDGELGDLSENVRRNVIGMAGWCEEYQIEIDE